MYISALAVHAEHMVNAAKAEAKRTGGFFADQFENQSNAQAHRDTGAEILHQCPARCDAFVCGSGTGGTIAGVSHALKAARAATRVVLVDPPGSSLYHKVRRLAASASSEPGRAGLSRERH